jgi:hypothetical protein
MTLTENQTSTKTRRERIRNLNLAESIFYPFLLANFAVSITLLTWKEDRFSSITAYITSWQFFFLASSAAIWAFPPVKTTADIYWIFSTLGFLFFVSVFGLNKWLQSIIYKAKIGSKISRKRNLRILNSLGIFLSLTAFLIFFISVVLKAYWYHTRFFWWNH